MGGKGDWREGWLGKEQEVGGRGGGVGGGVIQT